MDTAVVVEQVQHVAAVRAADAVEREQLEDALRDVGRLQAWLAAGKAAITSKLAAQVSFPEQTVADCTRESTRDAVNDKARADTLDAAPSLAAQVPVIGHIDSTALPNWPGKNPNESFGRKSPAAPELVEIEARVHAGVRRGDGRVRAADRVGAVPARRHTPRDPLAG